MNRASGQVTPNPRLPRARWLPRAPWLPRALWLPVMAVVVVTGCADRVAQLRRHIAAGPRIEVTYVDGTLVTEVNDAFTSSVLTPRAYRAIAATVRRTLEKELRRGRSPARADSGAGRLNVAVRVNGGYHCTGEPPRLQCMLTMQTELTFSTARDGRILGHRRNVVGVVWYGRHPVDMGPGDTAAGKGLPAIVAMANRIKREIPSVSLLEPLEGATAEGLAAFLEDMQISGG